SPCPPLEPPSTGRDSSWNASDHPDGYEARDRRGRPELGREDAKGGVGQGIGAVDMRVRREPPRERQCEADARSNRGTKGRPPRRRCAEHLTLDGAERQRSASVAHPEMATWNEISGRVARSDGVRRGATRLWRSRCRKVGAELAHQGPPRVLEANADEGAKR